MVMPPMDMNIYIPDPAAVVELNFGDHWRARWVETDTLPKGAPLTYGYVVVCMGDKGYLTRRKAPNASAPWAAPCPRARPPRRG